MKEREKKEYCIIRQKRGGKIKLNGIERVDNKEREGEI